MASANVTNGRRVTVPLSCTENQLREAVNRVAQSMDVLGNPAPAGPGFSPISAHPYPGSILTDFCLESGFTVDGLQQTATAKVTDTNGVPAVEPTSNTPAWPVGSPEPPATITVTSPAGAWRNAEAGDCGTAIRRDQTWWILFLNEGAGPPSAHPEGSFDFGGDLGGDLGPPPDGGGNFTDPDPPHEGQHICFVGGTVDHWLWWDGTTGEITTEGMTHICWFKGAHANAPISIVRRKANASSTDAWAVSALDPDGTPDSGDEYFSFFGSSGDGTVSATAQSTGGTWSDDDTFHFLGLEIKKLTDSPGERAQVRLNVDGTWYEAETATDAVEPPADSDEGGLCVNTDTPPEPVEGTTTGINTYCYDNVRFWDHAIDDEIVTHHYNGGTMLNYPY